MSVMGTRKGNKALPPPSSASPVRLWDEICEYESLSDGRKPAIFSMPNRRNSIGAVSLLPCDLFATSPGRPWVARAPKALLNFCP